MKRSTWSRVAIGLTTAVVMLGWSSDSQAQSYVKAERPQQSGYSLAVTTDGGKIIWLAGQTGATDDAGKPLVDFDSQVHQVFKVLGRNIEKAGGKLSDMVQMTVFITDQRYGPRLTAIRREILGDNFPGSALITIAGLANTEAKLEIQGIAVIGDK